MDFENLLSVANKNKDGKTKPPPGLKTEFKTNKRDPTSTKKPKGVQSAAVRAFLAKQEEEEKKKRKAEKAKKLELLRLRTEANHDRKAHAMASRTKDNIVILPEAQSESAMTPLSPESEPVYVDLFGKKKRNAHKVSSEILQLRPTITIKTPSNSSIVRSDKGSGSGSGTRKGKNFKSDDFIDDDDSSDDDKPPKSDEQLVGHVLKEWSKKISDRQKNEKSRDKHKHSKSEKHKDSKHEKHRDSNHEKHRDSKHEKHRDSKQEKHRDSKHEKHRDSKHEKHRDSKQEKHKDSKHEKHRDSKQEKHKDGERRDKDRDKNKMSVEKPKPKPPVIKRRQQAAPPSMNFAQLMAIANKKHLEPVELEKKAVEKKKPKKWEDERPMTQDEKDRLAERQARQKSKDYQDWYQYGKPPTQISHNSDSAKSASKDRPDSSQARTSATNSPVTPNSNKKPSNVPNKGPMPKSSQPGARPSQGYSNSPRPGSAIKGKTPQSMSSASSANSQKLSQSESPSKPMKMNLDKAKQQATLSKGQSSGNVVRPSQQQPQKSSNGVGKNRPMSGGKMPPGQNGRPPMKGSLQRQGNGKYDQSRENVLKCGKQSSRRHSLSDSGDDAPPKKPQGQGTKKPEPEEYISPWDRIYGQINKNKPKPKAMKRQILDSDESEYDSELDDFIDDDGGPEDYSSAIRDIFGYDKRKYRFENEDVTDMEVGYSQLMKEEKMSAKLGLQEDLEDMRLEEEMAKKKMMKKMKGVAAAKKMRR